MKYLSLLLLVTGCYQVQDLEIVEPELQQYWQQFQIEAQQLGVQLPRRDVMILVSDDLRQGQRAVCSGTKRYASIRIARGVLPLDGEYDLSVEATVFHELAHGLLDRHHMPVEDGAYDQVSLMCVPAHRPSYHDGTKRDYYIKELFYKL